MTPGKFTYCSPAALPEALSLLATYQGEARLLAGGQSLLALMKLRLAKPRYLIDLGRIAELRYIRDEGEEIAVGALTTYADIQDSALLRSQCPLLPQTAAMVGDVQIRNRGTLGGSLAHADPAADMPAAILALGATMRVVGSRGERHIGADDFFVTMLTTALAIDEILTEIRVPVLHGHKTSYAKAAPRPSDFAIVGTAVCLQVDQHYTCEHIAIGMTGLSDKASRARAVEDQLRGRRLEPQLIERAAAATTAGIEVMEDIRASRAYRSHLAALYVARTLKAML